MDKKLPKVNQPLLSFDAEDEHSCRKCQFFKFIENLPEGFYLKDRDGTFRYVNKCFADDLQLTPSQMIGKKDTEFFPQELVKVLAKNDKVVFNEKKSLANRLEKVGDLQKPSRHILISKIPVYNKKGVVSGLMGTYRDITEIKKLDDLRQGNINIDEQLNRLQEFNHLKTRLISTVSHELRTPLAIVKQLILLVYQETVGPINNQQREVLVKAQQNIERLKNLVDKMLDLSKIEGKKFKLRYSLVNLGEFMLETQELLKDLAKDRKHRLIYQLPKEDVNVFIDGEKIIQVVMNLVTNAIKFTGERGTIKVEAKVLERKVRIGVIDNGRGISPGNLKKIFDEFVQLPHADQSDQKGVGLGLAIVKELVERHGGEVWAESKKGKGSKFYFTLPRFYTASSVEKPVRDKINWLLKTKKTVCLINLLIIDYENFQHRFDINPEDLFVRLRGVIDKTLRQYPATGKKNERLILKDSVRGKYTILLPNQEEAKVAELCEQLRVNTKKYFVEHAIDDVFIALGMASYKGGQEKPKSPVVPSNLHIKEIYIGSEMRRWKRIQYRTKIEVFLADKTKLISFTQDLSRGGVCIVLPRLLNTDQRLRVRFTLLKQSRVITAQGQVAWITPVPPLPGEGIGTYKVGIEFLSLSQRNSVLLRQEIKLFYE